MSLLDNCIVRSNLLQGSLDVLNNINDDYNGRPLIMLTTCTNYILSSINTVRGKFNTLDNLRRDFNATAHANTNSNTNVNVNTTSTSGVYNNGSLLNHERIIGANYDGVFSNMAVKPTDLYDQDLIAKGILPEYENVVDDMAPLYEDDERNFLMDDYENNGIQDDYEQALPNGEILIYNLPTGTLVNFLWNLIISTSFQFIGFLITYFLHNSHAGKNGSRFGLGLTFIGYSYSMLPKRELSKSVGSSTAGSRNGEELMRIIVENPNEIDDLLIKMDPATSKFDHFSSDLVINTTPTFNITTASSTVSLKTIYDIPLLSIVIGALGLFILLKSVHDYAKVKKMERNYKEQFQA
ncbi:hypothetical protein TPHA_0G03450 [Tetrapisispora phaffii CBS 4417]|uniref:Uncharacterized protein n=1 Tax=Tetrapisispora phaffii (strain ATCC 24235 / CBS 4417 / NBRC 1672 / NRRL Y-8282 / UCD 70-5) TaxID=1071381 RepID=G8BWA7_TETPH|nr:hypothetical protein TPHA_0G03450 [Tetrapisispora phaffii CBS 4417]CCE64185.1 hypothetical protein TPHA_0G03450 [Tetrapisispora phaffii CBS 4417]